MSKISTEQKLELIRTIRLQNQYDRNQCRERERILYQPKSDYGRGELYSAESTVCLPGEELSPGIAGSKKRMFIGFRIRLLIAVIIFAGFVYAEKNQLEPGGFTPEEIVHRITENIDFSEILPGNVFDL